jgi:hypothetical protein
VTPVTSCYSHLPRPDRPYAPPAARRLTKNPKGWGNVESQFPSASSLTVWYGAGDNIGMIDDLRRYAPATVRNRDPILGVLRRNLPRCGVILEIASGSGEHITYFAQASGTDLVLQPSDPDLAARNSIDAWCGQLGLVNVRPAIALDASAPDWPIERADAVLCINMIHISPWSATVGLMRGAARILPRDGWLYLYGPFRRDGRHTAPSNEQFDEGLRQQNPEWAVRDIEQVIELAAANGFDAPAIEAMPANNLSLMFRRDGGAGINGR